MQDVLFSLFQQFLSSLFSVKKNNLDCICAFLSAPFHAKQEVTPEDCWRITQVNECLSVIICSEHSGGAAVLTREQGCDLDVRQKNVFLRHIVRKTV